MTLSAKFRWVGFHKIIRRETKLGILMQLERIRVLKWGYGLVINQFSIMSRALGFIATTAQRKKKKTKYLKNSRP